MSKKGEAGGCRFDIGVGDIGGVDPVCGVGDVDVDVRGELMSKS